MEILAWTLAAVAIVGNLWILFRRVRRGRLGAHAALRAVRDELRRLDRYEYRVITKASEKFSQSTARDLDAFGRDGWLLVQAGADRWIFVRKIRVIEKP